jgi:hypothetical protein
MKGASAIKNVAPAVTFFNDGGYTLLLAFGVIGGLTYLHYKHRTGPMMALVLLAGFLVIAPQIFLIFSVTGLLPDRWIVFLYVSLSILVVYFLLRMSSIIPGNIKKVCSITVIVLAIMFMMVTGNAANNDSPMVFNGSIRIGYTQSELTAANTLSDIGSGHPMTDKYFGIVYPMIVGFDRYTNLLQENSRVFIQRDYYLRHPEWNKYHMNIIIMNWRDDVETSRELVSAYMKVWGIDNWPIIYRNNNVAAYSSASLPAQYK